MLIPFFQALRSAHLPVSVKEFLTLLEALRAGVIGPSIDEFYFLARTTLVKDESLFDKFDRAFAAYFKGAEQAVADPARELPIEWLHHALELQLSPEEKAAIEKMGWDELMRTLQQRLQEQTERHEGGSRWIGSGGTSPFGHAGYNPQGILIGDKGGNKSAVKVWEQRAYRDYDDMRELVTSRWPCGACAGSHARAPLKSWTLPTPSTPRPPMPVCWTCAWSLSGTTA
jgi:uncharacterized protein